MRKLIVVSVVVGLLLAVVPVSAAPSMPALPGINAADVQPKGCVDCHVNANGNDFRLTKVLDGIKGGHPDIKNLVKNVPMDCLKCHYASAMAPVLGSMTHRNHYQNLKDNEFLIQDKGSCLSCHLVDINSGKVAVKNAPANW